MNFKRLIHNDKMNKKFSYLSNSEITTIETLYQKYLNNEEIDESWSYFFKGFEFAENYFSENKIITIPDKKNDSTENDSRLEKEFRVLNLIRNYRQRGHLFTKTNPVRTRRNYYPKLDSSNFGLTEADLELKFNAGNEIGIGKAKLSDIITHLKQTYCSSIGVEYLYIRKPEMVEWLQKRMETVKNIPVFTGEDKKLIFFHLKLAVGFEQFIHKKFIGQKRFSLEGAEAVIPALDAVLSKGAELGIEEFIIGMPHRGRLNILANTLQKPYENIFQEFIGKEYNENIELGDVKYHLGYGNDITTDSGKKVRVHLAPNPSHLETVAPIIEGIAKAKIQHKYHNNYEKLAPIVLHGDAAIAAQGVVYETIQMSHLKGYKTGGTIHLIINNQVGFTTNYLDARSSTYCTDIAKVTRSPVFHVNGDDVEALIYTIQLAVEYRQRFQSDVFIDLLCYRRYGHNEGDEPRFTQPLLYDIIAKHPNPRDIYAKQLIEEGIFSSEDVKQAIADFDEILENKLQKSKTLDKVFIQRFLIEDWGIFRFSKDSDFISSPQTSVEKKKLLEIAQTITDLPKDRTFFKKIKKLYNDRQKMITENRLDWAMCEQLAYATLLKEGVPVRISGQDCERGTFSHRHAAITLPDSEDKYFPLKKLSDKQAAFHVYNSHLSEYGVLGFEYGYSLAVPNGLTIWEAQFGDFSNVAQAIFDQYISSAEEKWGIQSGVVVYLPHGFEGQGPEHSSARVERYLSLAANNNMQIITCTTPANLFHALRRQLKWVFRLPLIIFTPKSLLRHPKMVSTFEELESGTFQEVIDDKNVMVEKVTRLVFCSGKIYFDLLKRKEELNVKDIALVRIEQLHPFPTQKIRKIIHKYQNKMLTLWVQEEPENMGAWRYVKEMIKEIEIEPVCRIASGSPAVGLNYLHKVGQEEIINKVFRRCDCELKNIYCGLQCVEGRSREEILKQHRYIFDK